MFGLPGEETLKGIAPYGKEYRAKQKARPLSQKIKEWYRDYCQDFHWDRGSQIEEMLDEEGDSHVKPSFKLFLYNMYRNFRGWKPIFALRMLFQKIFRKDHISDNELWGLDHSMAPYILKYLKAFKKSDRHGYPGYFSEYNENEWRSKEEYDEAVIEDRILGGGNKAWEKILDIIIMAFEYKVIDSLGLKREGDWYLKYLGMNPYDENNPCNKHVSFSYRKLDERPGVGSTMSSNEPNLDEVEWATKRESALNIELIHYAEECVQYGFELFGRFYQNLWD